MQKSEGRSPFWATGWGLWDRGRSPSQRKPANPQMKSEQRWQKVGLVSVTFRKLWPDAAGPGVLAPARSGPDPDPGPGPGPGRARPLPPSSGLEAGLPGRGELLPSQARARGSAAAAIPARAARPRRLARAGSAPRVRGGTASPPTPPSAPGFRLRPPLLRRRMLGGGGHGAGGGAWAGAVGLLGRGLGRRGGASVGTYWRWKTCRGACGPWVRAAA